MTRLGPVLRLCLLALAGCHAAPDAETIRERPAGVALPASSDGQLARFRSGLPEVHGLSGGAPSRDALVTAFMRALASRDTATLQRLILTKSEFAWLYYPTAREALPPYSLQPDLMWFTHQGRSEGGIRAALETLGGAGHTYLGYECPVGSRVEADNRLWGYCTVRHRAPDGTTHTDQLFGLILERSGVYKFVSYANKVD